MGPFQRIHLRLCLFALLCLITFQTSLTASFYNEPWGKDASLVTSIQPQCIKTCPTPLLGKFAEVMIAFHQEVISPADGPRSHFIPSSSQYTLDAMRKYGFFKGVSMGCDRLMRENEDPWIYRLTKDGAGELIKYDPVR